MIFASVPPVDGTGLENYDQDQRLKMQAEDLVHSLVLDMCTCVVCYIASILSDPLVLSWSQGVTM